jgi:hypothetical protein
LVPVALRSDVVVVVPLGEVLAVTVRGAVASWAPLESSTTTV